MRRAFLACLLFASSGTIAAEWPADPEADPCAAGSARGQGECATRRLAQHTDEMLAVYLQLMEALQQDDGEYKARSRLVQAQNAWVQYRDATCQFEAGITGGVTIWQSARTVHCKVSVTKERTAKLHSYLACAMEIGDACKEFM